MNNIDSKCDWVEIYNWEDGITYIDKTSISQAGSIVSAILKYETKTPGIDKRNRRETKGIIKAEQFNLVNNKYCDNYVSFIYMDDTISDIIDLDNEWSPASEGFLITLEYLKTWSSENQVLPKDNLIESFFINVKDYSAFLSELRERKIANDDATCIASLTKEEGYLCYELAHLPSDKFIGESAKYFDPTYKNVKQFNDGCKILADRLRIYMETDDYGRVPDTPPAFGDLTFDINAPDPDEEAKSAMMDSYYDAMSEVDKIKLGNSTGDKILYAAKMGDLEEIKRLMALSADKGGLLLLRLLAKDENGCSALDLATINGHKEIVDYLTNRNGL